MQVFNLDENESIDIIIIGGKNYEIGDIKPKTIEEIKKLPTKFIGDKKFLDKWKNIIIGILELKNSNFDKNIISEKHILQIIQIILKKIKNGEKKI